MAVTLNANSSTGFIATSDTSAILQLQTAGTTALTVDTSANVGIGTASPGTKLTVDGTVRATTIQAVNSVSSVNQFVSMTVDSVGTNINSSFVSSGNAHLLFSTSNTERMRVLGSAPILCLSGGSTTATGTGIAFPATQSASSDANTLDDYEEGTFTPVLVPSSGAVTTQSGSGTYVKVGRLVTLYYRVTLTTVGTAAGTMTMTNFPFASTSGDVSDVIASGVARENGATGASYQMIIKQSTTSALLLTMSTNAAAPFTNGYVYTGSLSYVVA